MYMYIYMCDRTNGTGRTHAVIKRMVSDRTHDVTRRRMATSALTDTAKSSSVFSPLSNCSTNSSFTSFVTNILAWPAGSVCMAAWTARDVACLSADSVTSSLGLCTSVTRPAFECFWQHKSHNFMLCHSSTLYMHSTLVAHTRTHMYMNNHV